MPTYAIETKFELGQQVWFKANPQLTGFIVSFSHGTTGFQAYVVAIGGENVAAHECELIDDRPIP